jgi:NAD(P)H dehydrogenase (quinone)
MCWAPQFRRSGFPNQSCDQKTIAFKKENIMTIAITGATGELGKLVVTALKGQSAEANPIALVRSPEKADALGVATRAFDYEKPEILRSALAGIDTLLLISSNAIGDREAQHRNVIDAAQAAGVGHIVYTSLLHADSSTIGLAEEHRATERLIRAAGVEYSFLRNGWYLENYNGAIAGAAATGRLTGAAGSGRISAASREDYALAAAKVLLDPGAHRGKTYELAGDDAFTLEQLAAAIQTEAKVIMQYDNLSEAEYVNYLVSLGVPEGFTSAMIAGWETEIAKDMLFDDSRVLSTLIGRPTKTLSAAIRSALTVS